MEIKSAQTVTGSLLKGLGAFRRAVPSAADPLLIYGGSESRKQNETRISNLPGLDSILINLFPS